ncbi:hypothetical protein THOG11_20349 [Vibrio harveyi]|nr:hypothetical protein TH15OA1_530051 [Vibrio harveyi]CAH1556947.1 hypothetical protein THOD03_20344 [Vibrio harveyi]CAH1564069.1 hypothetical protein THOG11_20349 [Vibrio harveyi]CAH1588323.1 hypothetical protein THZB04_50169 [Vibrio owensii]
MAPPISPMIILCYKMKNMDGHKKLTSGVPLLMMMVT